jgi:hypothetical protein
MGQSHSAPSAARSLPSASQQPFPNAPQTTVEQPADSTSHRPSEYDTTHPPSSSSRRGKAKAHVLALLSRRRRSHNDTGNTSVKHSTTNVTQSQRRRWPLLSRTRNSAPAQAQDDGIAHSILSNTTPAPLSSPPQISSSESPPANLVDESIPQRNESAEIRTHTHSNTLQHSGMTGHTTAEDSEVGVNQLDLQNDQTIVLDNNNTAPVEAVLTESTQTASAGQSAAVNIEPSPTSSPSERHEVGSNGQSTVAQPNTEQTTRGLPPSGTLIVVQGIVHTQDSPRTPSSSATSNTHSPQPSTVSDASSRSSSDGQPSAGSSQAQAPSSSHRASGLISQLLRRRNSLSQSPEQERPDDEANVRSNRSSADVATSIETTRSSSQEPPNNNQTDVAPTNATTAQAQSGPASTSPGSQESLAQMNSHSIDVLGALLR